MKNANLKIRWWPAVLIILFAASVLTMVWAWPETQRQQRYLRSAGVVLVSGFLLLIWLLLFSRTRWKIRLAFCAIVILGIGGPAVLLRIRGVNGDLLPILEPRWKAKESLPENQRQPAGGLVQPSPKTALAGFPQFMGPARNGVLAGPELETNWSRYPPQILWRKPLGSGWSGFAVQDGLAVTLEQSGDNESVVCYDAITGATIWSHAYPARYATTIAGEGPRSTTTIQDHRVYSFGATGILKCIDLAAGNVIWTKDAVQESGARIPDWGFASSPLVTGGEVIVSVGGADGPLRAYAAQDGKLVWASGRGGPDYSSPVFASFLGTPQIVDFSTVGVVGHAMDGKVLWEYPWPGGHPHISLPIVVSSNLFVASSGYGTGAELVRLDHDPRDPGGRWNGSRVWKSIGLKSKFGPLFHYGECVYGLDDGILTCLELKTGQRRWKDGRYGHGQGLLVHDLLLLTSEGGEVILIKPNPEKLMELGRFRVFSEKTWNPPALAGEYLLVRNDQEAACLQLRTRNRAKE
ncbi:MAG TPA: PQQ-binding-like beta-propeller repeat protein [Verrucomicrobiae bacterium]|nr:PQQ-binding-like beta-propeller repeat protein [Verrucomicrobiae bacterium]